MHDWDEKHRPRHHIAHSIAGGDGERAGQGEDEGGGDGRIAALFRTPHGRWKLRQRRAAQRAAGCSPAGGHDIPEAPVEPDASGVQVIEPDIENVASTPEEREAILVEMMRQDQAAAASRIAEEHIAGMVKTNIMARVVDARAAVEQGITEFEKVTESNPALERATGESLGGFAASVIAWLQSTAVSNIDRLMMRKPEGARLLSEPPQPGEDGLTLPERDHATAARSAFDGAVGAVSGGALEAKDGALMLGGVSTAIATTSLIGDYLASVHGSWVTEKSLTTLTMVTGRLRSQVDYALELLKANVELATPEQVATIAAQLDITRPFFVAVAVSDQLHVLFLESMRDVLGAGDYVDAMRGLRERQEASRVHGVKHHGNRFQDWRSQ